MFVSGCKNDKFWRKYLQQFDQQEGEFSRRNTMSQVDTLYLIHHSHTDVGYTHDQPIVWDLHGRFIEEGLRLADKYAGLQSDGAFRWTVENTAVFYEWLQHAPAGKIDRFVELERAGHIEVTGMFANITPLLDTDEIIESLRLVRLLREAYGFTITHAMNCDVNGENWPLVDLLLDAGIEGFTMAINTHFGGAPLHRPDVFWWEGPSGRRILAYNGWPYDTGWRFGIGRSAEMLEQEWWPRIEARLDEIDYPLPVLMAQSYHPFGDNGPAFEGFTTFIDEWNAQGKCPRIIFATPAMWWGAVKQYADRLPVYRGDWTDYWNFGCISSAREQRINRASRVRLRAADAAAAATIGLANSLPTLHAARAFDRYRAEAWKSLILWDEHTWGADVSLRAPESEDTAAQWHHKAGYAYTARSLSLMLQRDALADLARCVQRENPDDLLVFNPLPWPRRISGEAAYHVAKPRGTLDDATAGRHAQDRSWSTNLWAEAAALPNGIHPETRYIVPPVDVPGLGYRVIPRSSLAAVQTTGFSEDAAVENELFRLEFDTQSGGVLSFYDKRLDRELVDDTAGYALHEFIHEEVADRALPWPRKALFEMEWESDVLERESGWKTSWRAIRAQPRRVLVHRVYHAPDGVRVIQALEAPGVEGMLIQSAFLPGGGSDYVEFESWWDMRLTTHPEATYLVFPFAVPGAAARLDLGGQAITAGEDQLPGTCRDYYTAQGWVDFSNDDFGVTIALPENPMVQFGDFHFGHYQREFELARAMLLGWVTNSYWETNFRAHQPGGVHARYRVRPHAGGFNEIEAHRFGMEAAAGQPLLQHMGEPPAETVYPQRGSLLELPDGTDPQSPVLTLHVKPAWEGPGIVVRLLNASGSEQEVQIGSGLLRIRSAKLCDVLENPLEDLPAQDGAVRVQIAARRVATICLNVEVG